MILSFVKDDLSLRYERFKFDYDLEETFTFKDGGQTLINYKFHPDGMDILFIFSG
jgi:hypothetical protein